MGDQGIGRCDNAIADSNKISGDNQNMLPTSLISETKENDNFKQVNATTSIFSPIVSTGLEQNKQMMPHNSVLHYSGDNVIDGNEEKKPLAFFGGNQAEVRRAYNPGRDHVLPSNSFEEKGKTTCNPVLHNSRCARKFTAPLSSPQCFYEVGKMSHNPVQSKFSGMIHSTTTAMAYDGCSIGREGKKHVAPTKRCMIHSTTPTMACDGSSMVREEKKQVELSKGIFGKGIMASNQVVHNDGCIREGMVSLLPPQCFQDKGGTQEERKLPYNRAPYNLSHITKPPKITRKKKPSITQGDPSRQPCSVCGRVFKSWMALSGHMRVHPDREWRGILPPVEMSKGSSSVKDHDKHWSPLFNYGLILLADVALSLNNKETDELTNTVLAGTQIHVPTTQENDVGLNMDKKEKEESASTSREETKMSNSNPGKRKSVHPTPTTMFGHWGRSEVRSMTPAIKEATLGLEITTPESQPNNYILGPYSMSEQSIGASDGYSFNSNLEILAAAGKDRMTTESQFINHTLAIGSNSTSIQDQCNIKEQSTTKRCLDIDLNLPPSFEGDYEHQDSSYTEQ